MSEHTYCSYHTSKQSIARYQRPKFPHRAHASFCQPFSPSNTCLHAVPPRRRSSSWCALHVTFLVAKVDGTSAALNLSIWKVLYAAGKSNAVRTSRFEAHRTLSNGSRYGLRIISAIWIAHRRPMAVSATTLRNLGIPRSRTICALQTNADCGFTPSIEQQLNEDLLPLCGHSCVQRCLYCLGSHTAVSMSSCMTAVLHPQQQACRARIQCGR